MEKKATFGAGCFWGVESRFRKVDGVSDTRVGYAGGHTEGPNYADVCSGTTGHAEVVEVTYDPEQVSYDDLLNVFWETHNPTVKEKAQYRSVIFTHDAEQRDAAQRAVESKNGGRPVTTQVEDVPEFYEAEEYHQQYFDKHRVM